MAQTVSLALGTTPATSSDIIVPAGAQAMIGIYADTGVALSAAGTAFRAEVLLKTPGEAHAVDHLDTAKPTVIVNGPGTYQVRRNAAAVSVGVFSEV